LLEIKGKLISFEGIEGSGKSTQCRLLAEYLSNRGIPVLQIREPGGTAIGEQIRAILLNKVNRGMKPLTEFLLFAAARAQVINERILPALQEGNVVLCDRYIDSSLAYQGSGRGLGWELIDRINEAMGIVLNPHLTILLDIEVDEGLMRAKLNRKNLPDKMQEGRIEEEDLPFHKRVRGGYLELSRLQSERFRVISAVGSIEKVNRRVIAAVNNFFPQLKDEL